MQKKVIWESGMLVEPGHFEMGEQFLAEEHQAQWRAWLGESEYGLIQITWDKGALSESRLLLLDCLAIFPSGETWRYDAFKDSSITCLIERTDQAQYVYLKLPVEERYQRSVCSNQPAFQFLTPVIHLAHAPFNDSACLCVGRILSVDALGVHWDPCFIPHVWILQASDYLLTETKALLALIQSRREALFGQLMQLEQNNPLSLKQWHLWQVLSRHYPGFLSLIERRATVRALYESMRSIYFEIMALLEPSVSSFNASFDPQHLAPSFDPLFDELKRLLQRAWQQQANELSVAKLGSGYYSIKLCDRYQSLVLAVDADLSSNQINQLLSHLKLSSPGRLSGLVKHQLQGFPLILLSQSPREMPFHASRIYFQLDPRGDAWAEVLQEGHLAIHWPEVFSGLEWSIWSLSREVSNEHA